MAPRKGLSLEDKRQKLLAFFHHRHDFYNIKEIESAGSKFTGISSMQIKDVLQELLDENLVNCEKCGITNLYWVFKSQVYKMQIEQKKMLDHKLGSLIDKRDKLQALLNEEISKREMTFYDQSQAKQDRSCLLNEYQHLMEKLTNNKLQLQRLNKDDPELINNKIQLLLQLTTVYIDNISSMLKYFSQDPLRPIPSHELMKELQIDEDYDVL